MPPFAGLIGGSYQSRVAEADSERSVNWYPERVESPGGQTKTNYVLLSKPGLKPFAELEAGEGLIADNVPALCELNGRAFTVARTGANSVFYELYRNGSTRNYAGLLPGDRRPQLTISEKQILVLLAGNGYIFDQVANTLTRITDEDFPAGATKGAYLDGYFTVLEPNSQRFAISAYKDGTQWDALDFADVEGEPGYTVSLIEDHRQLWFFGNNHTEVYYDSGNADFPFSRYEGGLMEQGISAIDSLVKFDNALMWLGRNADGADIVWRANGYTPQRVSTHAVETAIGRYPRRDDATAYTYQEGGHTFYVIHFPSANSGAGATWVFDAATGFWHERGWWDAALGDYRGDLARCHCYAFGKHLVGDYRSGTIYEQSMNIYTDAGTPIRRLRAAPDLANGGKRMFYSELRLLMEVGVGLDGGSIGTETATYEWTGIVGGGTLNITHAPTTAFGPPWLLKSIAISDSAGPNAYSISITDQNGDIFGPFTLTEDSSNSGIVTFSPLIAMALATGEDANSTVTVTRTITGADVASDITATFAAPPAIPSAGTDPEIILQISNDGGRSWSNGRPKSMGKLGDYKKLVRWARLGSSRNRCFRVICSEPVFVALVAADLDVEAGSS